MWLSKMSVRSLGMSTDNAQVGRVTIGGERPGVETDSERRELTVAGPGGYRWTPKTGSQVLVLKTGEGEHLVTGALGDSQPEEIRLQAGGAELCLRDGCVTIRGNLRVEGNLQVTGTADIQTGLVVAGQPYAPCVCSLL